jgi:hypothetical protein
MPLHLVRQQTIGALLGLTLTFPLLGRISHLPASVVGLIFPLVAIVLAKPRLSRLTTPIVAALLLSALLVFQAAEPSQIEFIFHPANWMDHSAQYHESKLLMFLVAFAPVAVAAIAACLGGAILEHNEKYLALFLMIAGFFLICMKGGKLTLTCRLLGLSLIATTFAWSGPNDEART